MYFSGLWPDHHLIVSEIWSLKSKHNFSCLTSARCYPSWDTRSLILAYKQCLFSEFILFAYTLHCYCIIYSNLIKIILIFLFCFLPQPLKRSLNGQIAGKNMPAEKRGTRLCIQSDHRPWVYHQKVSVESTWNGLSCFRDSELQYRFWA